jgi:CBS domain-containing protein
MTALAKRSLSSVMVSELITLATEDTMDEVKRIFDQYIFHHIPIINEKQEIAGIISRTDLDKISWGKSFFKNPDRDKMNDILLRSLRVCNVMTKEPFTLSPDDTVADAYRAFKKGQFRAIPIVVENKLVGLITPYDLLDLLDITES